MANTAEDKLQTMINELTSKSLVKLNQMGNADERFEKLLTMSKELKDMSKFLEKEAQKHGKAEKDLQSKANKAAMKVQWDKIRFYLQDVQRKHSEQMKCLRLYSKFDAASTAIAIIAGSTGSLKSVQDVINKLRQDVDCELQSSHHDCELQSSHHAKETAQSSRHAE